MRKALLLSSVMLRGYGVSVVAGELIKRSQQHGWKIISGCLQYDEDYESDDCHVLPADAAVILDFCRRENIDVVVAQTSPYFEVLPAISAYYPTIAYEHGDPTPAFFDSDADERETIRRNKIENVYPKVNKVVTVSHFLKYDIEWPDAEVCYSGCDHVLNQTSVECTTRDPRSPTKIGTLMRLGAGEAQYKGNDIYVQLVHRLQQQIQIEPWIMGRGTLEDKRHWTELGVHTVINASDRDKEQYLSELDVFVSCSQWGHLYTFQLMID